MDYVGEGEGGMIWQNMYITICETDRQSRFDAWDRAFRAGALGWPWEMGWEGRWEEGSGWGTHVHPWLIYVNGWQKPLQYCEVISLQLNKFLKNVGCKLELLLKKNYSCLAASFNLWYINGGSAAKNPLANTEEIGSIPGSGKSPGEGNGNPLLYSCMGNRMDGGAWWTTGLGGHKKESDTT